LHIGFKVIVQVFYLSKKQSIAFALYTSLVLINKQCLLSSLFILILSFLKLG